MLQPLSQLKPLSATGPSTFKCEQTAVEHWSTHTEPTNPTAQGLCGRCCHPDLLLILQAIQLSITAADSLLYRGGLSLL